MGSGVEQFTGAHILNRLPVPAAAETVVGNFDHGNLAQNAGLNHIINLAEQGTETRLLENSEEFSGLFLNFQKTVNFRNSVGQRFFADDIKTCFHGFNGNINVFVTAAGIDDQFNFLVCQQFFVINIMFAVGIGACIRIGSAFRNGIGNGDHIKTFLKQRAAFKKVTVDISSAASLTDNTYFDLFHDKNPL